MVQRRTARHPLGVMEEEIVVRIILRRDDAGMAANVGGAVLTTYHTVDIIEPTIEELLRQSNVPGSLCHTQIIGSQLIPA